MKQLTKAEEEIMQVLWKLGKGYVREIIAELPLPSPAYNTVSTIIRILEKKGFVGYEATGKSHCYYPLIKKKAYRKRYFKEVFNNYFENSYGVLASFFTKEQNLTLEELEEMRSLIEEEIDRKKNNQ